MADIETTSDAAPSTKDPPVDPPAVRARYDAACAMVSALCRPRGAAGSREWVMSIPARPAHDPDIVIGDALADVPRLLAEVERLTRERDLGHAAMMRVLQRVSHECGEPRDDADPWLVALLGDYVLERARLRGVAGYRADGPLTGWDAPPAPLATPTGTPA